MKTIFYIFILFAGTGVHAQVFMTRNAAIKFYSSTPLEDIRAVNNQCAAAVDVSKKNIAFSCLVKGFRFDKALMEEHFNENYAESDKYPQATFTGNFAEDIDLGKDGKSNVTVTGDLKFHGAVKRISLPAVLEVKNGEIIASALFSVKPQDFNIRIPSLVKDKIAKEITINVNAICKRR